MSSQTVRSLPSPHRRLALRVVFLAILAVAVPSAAAAGSSARPSADAPLTTAVPAAPGTAGTATLTGADGRRKKQPTIVLVHGAWADSSSWSGVARRLQTLGYPVRVAAVPLRGLARDSADLASFVSTIRGPLVLVGHSYGGGVITNMGTSDPDVQALVFVDAFAPDAGEKLSSLSGPDSALAVTDPTTVFDFVPYAGGPQGDVDLYLKQRVFVRACANDIPKPRAKLLWATQRPVTASAGNEPSGAPAWSALQSWYVLGTRDLIIPPSAQRRMAQRAGAAIVRVRAGHLSPVSRPRAVARVIVRAATHAAH